MAVNLSLREFLVSGAWKERFDGFVLEDGSKLARKRRVSEMSWESLEDGGGVLAARVQDLEGEYYEVEISIWQEISPDCNVPFSEGILNTGVQLGDGCMILELAANLSGF